MTPTFWSQTINKVPASGDKVVAHRVQNVPGQEKKMFQEERNVQPYKRVLNFKWDYRCGPCIWIDGVFHWYCLVDSEWSARLSSIGVNWVDWEVWNLV
jgi:hypothetical protein